MVGTEGPNGPRTGPSKLRSIYEILRFRGSFSGSCWRFLGIGVTKEVTKNRSFCLWTTLHDDVLGRKKKPRFSLWILQQVWQGWVFTVFHPLKKVACNYSLIMIYHWSTKLDTGFPNPTRQSHCMQSLPNSTTHIKTQLWHQSTWPSLATYVPFHPKANHFLMDGDGEFPTISYVKIWWFIIQLKSQPFISIHNHQVSGDAICAHVTSMRQMSMRFGTRRMSWNRRKVTESKRMFRPGWCSQGVPLGISAPDLWLLSCDFRWRVRAARATSLQSKIEVLINPKDPGDPLMERFFFHQPCIKRVVFRSSK